MDPTRSPSSLPVEAFLDARAHAPVFDVRTPAEYARAHIPGAINLPLFSDDERAEIGTLYKHEGPRTAQLRGLDVVGPRMRALVERVVGEQPSGRVLVHCWRGGMRSASVAWLLGLFGYQVQTLAGGYKAFRRHCLDALDRPRTLRVLSGATGTGKTLVLHALARLGEPVVDLEALARHKGSVFGALGEEPQPSQEHFENLLALALEAVPPGRPVWIEDESRLVGRRVIPGTLWNQMQSAPTFVLRVPEDERVGLLVEAYGGYPAAELETCIRRIDRRLGGQRTRQALEALDRGDLPGVCRLLLSYYDRAYTRCLDERRPGTVTPLESPTADPERNARTLLAAAAAAGSPSLPRSARSTARVT